jgi:hypothetical protein
MSKYISFRVLFSGWHEFSETKKKLQLLIPKTFSVLGHQRMNGQLLEMARRWVQFSSKSVNQSSHSNEFQFWRRYSDKKRHEAAWTGKVAGCMQHTCCQQGLS